MPPFLSRVVLFAFAAIGLAGCAEIGFGTGVAPVDPNAAPGFNQVVARFVSGQDVDVIEVRSLDPAPMRAADLVAADGTRMPAESIDVEASPTRTTPFDPTGIGGIPTFNSAIGMQPIAPGQPQRVTTLVGQNASAALIRPDDPASYRRSWRTAHLEIRLGDGASARIVTLPAPAPLD
ncbi:MAG TPA: hypothetical protein VNT30_12690 [Stellaceae bacterium]|nr:hypothetical protein [Stellaceae bacterium]